MYLHNDVVDGYVDEFDEETNETHNAKTDGRSDGDFLELCKRNKIDKLIANQYQSVREPPRLPFLSGLVHRFTNLTESLENWRPGSNTFVT